MIFIFKINTNTVVWLMCILQIIIELVRLFVWRLMIDWLPFITLCNIASDKWKNIIDFLQIMVNCGRLTMMIMLLPCSCINSYKFLLDNSTNSDRFTLLTPSLFHILCWYWYDICGFVWQKSVFEHLTVMANVNWLTFIILFLLHLLSKLRLSWCV